MTYIGLLDCNNFFVSCERLFRPDLAWRPVVVLSGNDGCVVARSNEVKELGIPMGVPYFKVEKELKTAQVAIFSSNFTLYRDISKRVMARLREETAQIEQYSVDEAFFGIRAEDEVSIEAEMRRIKAVIEKDIGVPVSIGAAKSKTIAKQAAEQEKRGTGVCLLTGEHWQQVAGELSVGAVWGIGRRTAEKCVRHEVRTVAEYMALDRARVAALFGVDGVRKHQELNEQSVYRLGERSAAEQQSIMSTRSMKQALTNRDQIEVALLYHVDQVARQLREKKLEATRLSVMIRPSRHGDWALRGGTAEELLALPSNDTRTLSITARALCRSLYEVEVPYKKVGVVVSGLRPEGISQGELFAATDQSEKRDDGKVVMAVVDALNDKYGRETMLFGRVRGSRVWDGKHDRLSPQYTTNWSEIADIRAN